MEPVEIRAISFIQYAPQAVELAVAHWKETESGLTSQPPRLDFDSYTVLEEAGNLVTFGAFRDGQMVGYSVATVCPHPHYGFHCAAHDLLYVRPDCRGWVGLRLISATEKAAKERGARFFAWHAKLGSPLQKIFDRLRGYTPEELVYLKEL